VAEVTVRGATAGDAALILGLVRELAAFERAAPDAVRASEDDFRREIAGPRPSFECLIAELDGSPVGLALFFQTFSAREGRRGVYLEDLYVREQARGIGVGRRLMAALARLALERGWCRLDLRVLHGNPARRFYEELGLRHVEAAGLPYSAESEVLARLARGGAP
jgi:GNAT superfamily N-acetyltransferase